MHLPEVIVFFGCKGSGKDTAASHIQGRWPGTTSRVAFADPLKEIVLSTFPEIPREHLYGDTNLREVECERYPLPGDCMRCGTHCEKIGQKDRYWKCIRCELVFPQYLSPRVALQALGTEWGRRCYQNTWVERGFRYAKEASPALITDGRFFNEHAYSREQGACLVYLARGLDRSTDPHASEAEPRALGHGARKGTYHFDIFLDNEYLTIEAARDRLLSELEQLAERRVTHIKWSSDAV